MIVNFLQEYQGFRNARVIELFISLLQVAPTQTVKLKLFELMKQITQSRLDAEQASIEARIFETVLKCEGVVKCGKISTQVITELFNDGLSDREQVSSRFIGRRVAALGFAKCKVGDKGQAGFYYDKALIERLKARYFPNGLQLTPETSESSETPVNMEKHGLMGYLHTGVTGVSSSIEKPQENYNLPLKTGVSGVSEVTGVKSQEQSQGYNKETALTNYTQLICYFCQKEIMENDWVQNEFTGNKPTHKNCYTEHRKQLKQSSEILS
jgi:hypothetical protein